MLSFNTMYLSKLFNHSVRLTRNVGLNIRFLSISGLVQGRFGSSSTDNVNINHISDVEGMRSVRVKWNDDASSDYPHIFLRDNCQCPLCFHPTSKQRKLDLVKLIDINIEAESIKHSSENDQVIIHWPDGHVSEYPGNWLRARMFPKTWADVKPSSLYNIQPVSWVVYNCDSKWINYE